MKDYNQDSTLESSVNSIRIKKVLIVFLLIFLFLIFSFFFFKYSGFNFNSEDLISNHNNSIINQFLFLGAAFLLFLGYIFQRIYNAQNIFYGRFARINKFDFLAKKDIELKGIFFKEEESTRIENEITGKINDYSFDFFNYSKKLDEVEVKKSILRIGLDTMIPKILFTNDKLLIENYLDDYFKGSGSKIGLDGSLTENYFLVSEKNFEIEALQIFSQELQLKMADEYPKFSLDFNNKDIFIYSQNQILTKKELYQIFELAEYLTTNNVPILKRLETEYLDLKKLY